MPATAPLPLPTFPIHHSCTRCPLHTLAGDEGHVGIPTIHLPSSRPPSPPSSPPAVVFVGQNPGYHENLAGAPFVGASGAVLREGYIDGISLSSRASVYLTNAVRCITERTSSGYATPIFTRHTAPCSIHLLDDLRAISALHPPPAPLCIVCCGLVAVSTIYRHVLHLPRKPQKASFRDSTRAFLAPPLQRAIILFSTWHPAAVLRQPNLRYSVADHMELLSRYLAGALPAPSSPRLIPARGPSAA